ncbi:chymotrypsin family serine protease [Sphaerisporangium aureirubrum]|uniref:Uncharacterized protein n=1 Tax=Sphaerisporangium aureirubrum TaxID=1544736 RepID=A0ABW1NNK8_9ACTN
MAAALGVVLIVAGLGPAPAAAAPTPGPAEDTATRAVEPAGTVPGGFASWKDLLATQEKLAKAADRVTAAAEALGGAGLGGIVVAPETRELRVYWKGDTPASIGRLVEGLRRDVPVSVLPAAYSARELEREANHLIRASGGAITAVAPNADGSGLKVSVAAGGPALAKIAASAVPVTLEAGVTPALASRWNDSPPWWSGAAMRNATTQSGCTTGLAVTYGGATRMLSSAHCGSPGQVVTDPTGEPIGPIAASVPSRDVSLITANAAGRVWNNNYPSPPLPLTPEWSNPVVGVTGSYPGMSVCTTGAYSGTVCICRIIATNVTINVGYVIYGMVLVENTSHKNAAGQGDSGGPVETPEPTQTTQQYGLGTITAIDTASQVPCTGYVTTGRICSWRLYYSPWSNATIAFPGIALVTG